MARTLLIMLLAGWAAAGTPFRGDQALFCIYAREMAQGKVLYRDLWDVTNPGIYWFYELAGSAFGFTEDGIHFGEWLWFTAFVFVLGYAILRRFEMETWPQSPAIFVGAWYYFTSCADPSHLTKVEGLVAFPMFVSIWAMSHGLNRRWLLLAGIAGGVVILFKLAFLLCLLPPFLLLLSGGRQPPVQPLPRGVNTPRSVWRILFLPLGTVIVLALAVAYFSHRDAFANTLEALFVTPREMLAAAEPADYTRLATSLRWFVEAGTPLLVLAAAGSLLMRRDQLVRSYWCMLPAALIVILIQRWSWWTYHFLLLSLPLTVLAAYTWPALQTWMEDKLPTRRERVAVYLLIALLFLAPLGHGAMAYFRMLPHRFGITGADRAVARLGTGNAYRIAAEETAWLPDAKPGPIFVAGDPLYYEFANRDQATRTHGWSLELFTPKLWQQLLEDLHRDPPIYIYIDRGDLRYEWLIAAKSPELLDWVWKHYAMHHETKHGLWFERAQR